jgi:hypothetical protein
MVLALGCGEEPAPVYATGDGGAAIMVAPDGGCYDGQTTACTCNDEQNRGKAGTQQCFSNTWLLCNCNAATQGPVSVAGDCLPGRYEGNFTGLYYSGFAPGGFPVPVIGIDVSGLPPLTLTLRESGGGGNGATEFATYSVSDGVVKGTADGIFPFEGTITGELNCASKLFKGTFTGRYSLGIDIGTVSDINQGFFVGPVTAVYDGVKHTFKPGTWDVLETAGQGGAGAGAGWGFTIAKLGGNGDWYADYKGAATSDAGVQPVVDAGP